MSHSIKRKLLPYKLLVEGKDDLYVIANLREKNLIPETVEIIPCEGVEKIPEVLINYLRLKRPQIQSIGIVVDADRNIINRWESLKNLLVTQGYQVAENPTVTGTIIKGENRNPDIGIWIMPDNKQQVGMLEDFFLKMISEDDQLLPVVKRTLEFIEQQQINRYEFTHQAKARVHTWLSWQQDPGTTLGLAIKKSYLNHQAELGTVFIEWYKTLFQL